MSQQTAFRDIELFDDTGELELTGTVQGFFFFNLFKGVWNTDHTTIFAEVATFRTNTFGDECVLTDNDMSSVPWEISPSLRLSLKAGPSSVIWNRI